MAVLRIIGTKNLVIGGLAVALTATIEQDDANGQIFAHVHGTAGAETIEERAGIGAADGNDALTGLTPAEVQIALQTVIDGLRQKIGKRLATLTAIKMGVDQIT